VIVEIPAIVDEGRARLQIIAGGGVEDRIPLDDRVGVEARAQIGALADDRVNQR
jgi:hypothetical protein